MSEEPDFITENGFGVETTPKDDNSNERVKAYVDMITNSSDKRQE